MSIRRPSWLLPALSIVVTMLLTGGVFLYLNPDRASALDDATPTGSSLAVAATEGEGDSATVCPSGSNVCISASACAGGSCTTQQCIEACEEAGVECSEACVAACTNGSCSGDCTGDGTCIGDGTCKGDGKGGCVSSASSSKSGGCCSR